MTANIVEEVNICISSSLIIHIWDLPVNVSLCIVLLFFIFINCPVADSSMEGKM